MTITPAVKGALVGAFVIIAIHLMFNAAGYSWTMGRIKAASRAQEKGLL